MKTAGNSLPTTSVKSGSIQGERRASNHSRDIAIPLDASGSHSTALTLSSEPSSLPSDDRFLSVQTDGRRASEGADALRQIPHYDTMATDGRLGLIDHAADRVRLLRAVRASIY